MAETLRFAQGGQGQAILTLNGVGPTDMNEFSR